VAALGIKGEQRQQRFPRVVTVLKREKCISWSDLMQKVGVRKNHLEEIIAQLAADGKVTTWREGRGQWLRWIGGAADPTA